MVDSTENAPTATPAETASCWLTLTSVVARLICAGSTSAYASVLMAVNCSERKKPPTTSRIMISSNGVAMVNSAQAARKIELTTDRKSTRLNSSHQIISYAVFCLKKKKKTTTTNQP